ncbi:LolA family protein [Arthrobacter sp. H41]|uniref:LolA family protein n=1 Tax=Arthrobacter sp. H41 TaxID=1312978 RepID=UPI00047D4C42|nr:sigma-E factor regulatory protein RseB domain-containing protein [Arthrobacter sp. H41]
MNKKWLRWLPAGIVPVVILTATVAGPTTADASPQLPDKTAQELLELVAESSDSAYSGTLEQSSELGLPDLQGMTSPGGGGTDGASAALELLTGSHTAQVHIDGTNKARLQVMDQLAQRDVIVNDDEVWLYDSRAKEATHAVLPEHEKSPEHSIPGSAHTPAALAEKFLSIIDSSTEVTVGDDARVAGRDAYELVLTPRADDTLVGAVSLTVDAETGLPLGFAVAAEGQEDPAFSVAFSSIDFNEPADSLFEFTPPPEATVTEVPVKEHDEAHAAPEHDDAEYASDKPTVLGEGWNTIVVLPAGSASGLLDGGMGEGDDAGSVDSSRGGDSAEAQALLEQALTQVDGGRVLETALVSVLITDDGRVLAGAVSADQLIAAAQQ